MISHLYRLWAMSLVPIALIACTNYGTLAADQGAAPPLGVDLGGSGPVSYLVTADAPGRWAYHCHLLYHMETGMFREVHVA